MTSDPMDLNAHKVILDSIADGVFTVDGEWRITTFNRAAEQITGFSREEAIGEKCFDIFRTHLCQSDCILKRSIETGKEFVNFPVTILTRDGREKPISISAAILRDPRGKVTGGVETFRDITAIETLRKALTKQYVFEDIISKNHRMQELFRILPDIAESESSVLVEGPSGSGKELFARAIHNLSPRKDKPFVSVNCGALPDTLLESELFGYKQGAFTDARRDKPGRFALAEGGTLFLDEIGDISAALQVKLLRVLQEKVYEPLGATVSSRADARIVTATNRDLREEMARGRFRDDLYYRLNVVRLEIPSLEKRREDIPLLVDHFITHFNSAKGKAIVGVSDEVLSILMSYPFPGNVRELENVIEHAFILCKGGLIEPGSLPRELVEAVGYTPPVLSGEAPAESGLSPLKSAEAEAIRLALDRHDGHRERTARALGVHKTTLLRKMKRLGIAYTKGERAD